MPDMQVVPNIKPPPRLLSSAAVDVQSRDAVDVKDSRHKLKRSDTFGGNGRAIFVGLLLGALAVTGLGYFWHSPESAEHQLASVRRFFAVRTRSVFNIAPAGENAGPLSVKIHPSMLRVTAIALGHPRLAIINGKEVTEGDEITLKSPGGGISVTLRVVNIVEGRIELTDGTHVVTAPMMSGNSGPGR
jgi:hypothetical protein